MIAQQRKLALEARLRNKAPQLITAKDAKAIPPTCIPQSISQPIPMNISLTATPQGPQFVPKQMTARSMPSPIPVPDDKRVPIKTPLIQQVNSSSDPLDHARAMIGTSLPPNTVPWRTQANKVPHPVSAGSVNQNESLTKQSADSTTVNVTIRYVLSLKFGYSCSRLH